MEPRVPPCKEVHEPDSLQVMTKALLLLVSQAMCLSAVSPSTDHTKAVLPSNGGEESLVLYQRLLEMESGGQGKIEEFKKRGRRVEQRRSKRLT